MRIAGNKTTTLWEWVVIFGSVAAVVAITKVAGIAPVWQTAFAYTVIVFVCLIVALRSAWSRPNFWRALIVALVLHALAVFSAIREFPRTSQEFHGIPLIASGVVEGLLILSFLWRASTKKSSQRPS
jgi:hypothetical protein